MEGERERETVVVIWKMRISVSTHAAGGESGLEKMENVDSTICFMENMSQNGQSCLSSMSVH